MKRILVFLGLKIAEIAGVILALIIYAIFLIGVVYGFRWLLNNMLWVLWMFGVLAFGMLGYLWFKANWKWAGKITKKK